MVVVVVDGNINVVGQGDKISRSVQTKGGNPGRHISETSEATVRRQQVGSLRETDGSFLRRADSFRIHLILVSMHQVGSTVTVQSPVSASAFSQSIVKEPASYRE